MKTPRDLILEKHRHADAKLAAIRPEDLAAAARLSVTLSPIGGEGQGEGASAAPNTIAAALQDSSPSLPTQLEERDGERRGSLLEPAIAVSTIRPKRFRLAGREVRMNLYSIAQNFWHESILPWRRVWAGMATVWLGIFVLNVASHGAPQMTVAKASPADSRVVLAAWRERRQVLAQLLGPALPAAEAVRPIPGPRSSLRVELMVV